MPGAVASPSQAPPGFLAGKLPPLLTFLGSHRLLPDFAVLLAGDLGEGEEAEEQVGSPERHAAAVRCRAEVEWLRSALRQPA